LLAFSIAAKFCDAVPFYRQNKIFARFGIDIPRSTMCDWTIAVSLRCEPIVEEFLVQILAGPLVLMDETTTQVMHEIGRANTTKSYMWVMRGGDPETPVLVYRYHPSRSKEIPAQYLSEYEGYLQSDGYDGYEEIGNSDGIIHVGCWAHARRYFFEASKVNKKTGAAEEGLSRIRGLYRIETELRKQLSDNKITRKQFVEQRKERTAPLFSSMKEWLEQKQDQVPPSTKLGKAVSYTLGQWEKLVRYPEQWYLTPDTNLVENAIRPFVVGRKNWLLSGSPRGAHASATLYTLIETARANGLEPYRYLAYIFSKVPTACTDEDFARLTPKYLDQNEYSVFLSDPGG